MALQSAILSVSARLRAVAAGGTPVRPAPPHDDPEAVRCIQKALAALGFPMPRSFPNGPLAEPDGKYGSETQGAVITFQRRVFPSNRREWDGVVGKKTLEKLDALLPRAQGPPPRPNPAPTPPLPGPSNFICGPDVTEQVAQIWSRIQSDFRALSFIQKVTACNTILIPLKGADSLLPGGIPTNIEELKQKLRNIADIDGWDVIPLFQGASGWLRRSPVFDPARNGPCATPSSSNPGGGPFDAGHEDPATCSNSVQVQGQCWLNGSVNYGTFGIMVRACSDFAADDVRLRLTPLRQVYSLEWARMLIRAYKRFGNNPEGAAIPVAWTEATFNGGPRAVPSIPGNRPRCRCTCNCTGDAFGAWDYIWKPHRPGGRPTR